MKNALYPSLHSLYTHVFHTRAHFRLPNKATGVSMITQGKLYTPMMMTMMTTRNDILLFVLVMRGTIKVYFHIYMKVFFVYFKCDQHYVLLTVARIIHGLHECTILVYVSVFIMENGKSE